ncbi:type II secretion system protein N [Aliidiomarina sp. Khilg15.8]
MSKWKLITLLVVVYLAGLLILLPARVVAYVVDAPSGVRWSQVEGTLWSGTLGALQVEDVVLRDVDWQLQPLALLKGQLQADIHIREHPDNLLAGQGRIALGRSSLRIESLSADARLADLAAMSPVRSPFDLQGRVDVSVDHFDWGQPICSQLQGRVQAADVALRIGRNWQELGTFSASLNCEEGRVAALIDADNRLGLSGNALLDTAGMRGEVRLQPGADAPRTISDFFNMLPEQARQTQRFNVTF